MLYKKDKVIINVNHGEGDRIVGPLRGTIDSIIVKPDCKDRVIYDFSVYDQDSDEIFFRKNIVNKVFFSNQIPVGKSSDENIRIKIYNSSRNVDFSIVLLIKER